ncbi:hypothetical protein FJ417_18620 [Mesorhizobium sp. B3-1-7]|uniref:hypothetical protein n=1 Tax=Mesorhizobium sp. B3-1-7 TaxID=2589894 RepID=UPI00112A7413|nr:hypothetical protein [Mesorhizobium sp. B3-1-7]TPI58639.1 hypothetical protein FJ417_18620 [Mesorhizobium sp. B3-1-7]
MDLFNPKRPIKRPDTSRHLSDPWLATSALQKAIRRGHQAIALAATSFLLNGQADRFWRRAVVIGLEDIGIGDLDLIREVLLVSTRKGWRAEHGGDWNVASQLVHRLCAALKSRDACELLVAADLHPRWKEHRTAFLDLTQHQLSDIVADPVRHLVERTLASWLIVGTKRFPAYSMPEVDGSFAALLDVYRHIGVAENVLEVARLGSTRTDEGHALTLPLVWLVASQGPVTIQSEQLPEHVLIRGWPSFSFDMHNRVGRRALALFADRCTALRQMMQRHLPVSAHADLVGHLVFRIEGHVVDRQLDYPGAGAILRDAEIAHLTFSGFPETLVTDLLAIFGDHPDLLLQCRIEAAGGRA